MYYLNRNIIILFGIIFLLPLVNALDTYCDNVFCYSDLNGNPLKYTNEFGLAGNLTNNGAVYNQTAGWFSSNGLNQSLDIISEDIVNINDSITICLNVIAYNNSCSGSDDIIVATDYLQIKCRDGAIGTRYDNSGALGKSVPFSNNVYYHFCGSQTVETNLSQIWLDGVYKGNTTQSRSYSLNYNTTLLGFVSSQNFNGSIDNVMIFRRILSSSEVSSLYNGQYVNRSGLIFEARFTNNSIITDTSIYSQKADKYFSQCTDGNCKSSDILLNSPYDYDVTDYSMYNMSPTGNSCSFVAEGYYNCSGFGAGIPYNPNTYTQLNFTQYSNVTMGVWVWTDNLTTCYGHNTTRIAGLIGINFRLALDTGSGSNCNPRFGIRNESGSLQNVLAMSTGVVQTGWRNYVGVKNTTHISLYYDGVLQGTTAFSTDIIMSNAGAGNLEVAGNNIINSDGKTFIGYVDMPFIANRAFSPEEVYQQYLYGRERLPYIGSKDYIGGN